MMSFKALTITVLLAVLGTVYSGCSKPIPSIYGEFAPEEPIKFYDQQAIVATLIALLFVLMALEVTGPEVLFTIALTIVTLCEIITLPDALSGKFINLIYSYL